MLPLLGRFRLPKTLLVVAVCALTAALSPTSGAAGSAVSDDPTAVDYTFLSTPDFLNADIGDISGSPYYEPGSPNSINPAYRKTLSVILDAFASEKPQDVLVAGDLVNGHWDYDASRQDSFGPLDTSAHIRAAVARAGRIYYRQWRARFTARGLTVHAALGDHDLGDNPWSGSKHSEWRLHHLDMYKGVFARHLVAPNHYHSHPAGPAARTAYSTYLSPEVLLVTVDEFTKGAKDVHVRLDSRQLSWLKRVLEAANRRGTDWIIVQGHTPVVTPVRHWGSSQLRYEGGTSSAFWRTMVRNQVDLYLTGEVHDITAHHVDGITQINHGGIVNAAPLSGRGGTNYLLGEVRGDQMSLRVNRFLPYDVRAGSGLWQSGKLSYPVASKSVYANPPVVGTMTLTSDNQVVSSTGLLAPYVP